MPMHTTRQKSMILFIVPITLHGKATSGGCRCPEGGVKCMQSKARTKSPRSQVERSWPRMFKRKAMKKDIDNQEIDKMVRRASTCLH